ncbi:MAG: hypothetical protein DDT27_00611 [Dehalococcoidia bacterium]|nr:hypothetical protein [Chloroflexota bacterium]
MVGGVLPEVPVLPGPLHLCNCLFPLFAESVHFSFQSLAAFSGKPDRFLGRRYRFYPGLLLIDKVSDRIRHDPSPLFGIIEKSFQRLESPLAIGGLPGSSHKIFHLLGAQGKEGTLPALHAKTHQISPHRGRGIAQKFLYRPVHRDATPRSRILVHTPSCPFSISISTDSKGSPGGRSY